MTTAPRRSTHLTLPLLLAAVPLFLGLLLWSGSPPTKNTPTTPVHGTVSSTDGDSTPPITHIVIDAGHGGEDGGTSSATGVVEKDVNLEVAFALRELYEAAGIPVIMTRTEDKLLYDRNVDFQGRKKVLDLASRRMIAEKTADAAAESAGTSLFISIHMNAFPAEQYSGMQVWYGADSPRSQEIAEAIQCASTSLMPDNHRRIKAAGSHIYLLHRIKTPAVLVECGFLSNPAEAERLSQPDYRLALAALIFSATSPYLSTQ